MTSPIRFHLRGQEHQTKCGEPINSVNYIGTDEQLNGQQGCKRCKNLRTAQKQRQIQEKKAPRRRSVGTPSEHAPDASTRRLDAVLFAAAAHFQFPVDSLLGPERTQEIAYARQLTWYVARQLRPQPGYSLLGRVFRRDHTTIMTALSKLEERIPDDEKLKQDIERLSHRIQLSLEGVQASGVPMEVLRVLGYELRLDTSSYSYVYDGALATLIVRLEQERWRGIALFMLGDCEAELTVLSQTMDGAALKLADRIMRLSARLHQLQHGEEKEAGDAETHAPFGLLPAPGS